MFVAVGYHNLNRLRAERCDAARTKGYHLVSYISRVADCGDWAEVGDNCLILDSVGVQPGARVGDNVWVWNNTLIGHHSSVGDHCWLAAGTTIGGCARIAERCFIGLGATIGGDLRLGAESFIGAGALLTKDAEAQSVFITRDTERYRLDARTFLRMTRLATIGPGQQPEST
jgi:UDP-3-O-[3-hydroxymyristoyl] glucosamine N-acyltransferase